MPSVGNQYLSVCEGAVVFHKVIAIFLIWHELNQSTLIAKGISSSSWLDLCLISSFPLHPQAIPHPDDASRAIIMEGAAWTISSTSECIAQAVYPTL